MNTKTNDELVAEIHESFYTADERLLQEAKQILSTKIDSSKADRIKKLGFGSAKPVKTLSEYSEKVANAKSIVSSIEYWRIKYPNNKFITEAEVKRICEKYGLVLGDAGNYLGDIPEKNLAEIEAFNLKKEDWVEKSLSSVWDQLITLYSSRPQYQSEFLGLLPSIRQQESPFMKGLDQELIGEYFKQKPSVGIYKKTKEPKKQKERPAFKICAPHHDFHTSGYIVQDGYVLVYDPVVLQPVKDGYLIVTAWGAEASDEIVVNQNQN